MKVSALRLGAAQLEPNKGTPKEHARDSQRTMPSTIQMCQLVNVDAQTTTTTTMNSSGGTKTELGQVSGTEIAGKHLL